MKDRLLKEPTVWWAVQSIKVSKKKKEKKVLDLIKILNIPLITQVMLEVFVDLKSLVSINLYNPVLHNTAGHAPHTYVSSARITFYMDENIVCS